MKAPMIMENLWCEIVRVGETLVGHTLLVYQPTPRCNPTGCPPMIGTIAWTTAAKTRRGRSVKTASKSTLAI